MKQLKHSFHSPMVSHEFIESVSLKTAESAIKEKRIENHGVNHSVEYDQTVIDEIIQSLTLPQKELSAKFFYDSKGSELFDEICNLKEYYPYRTEMSMLPKIAKDMANFFSGELDVVEFGAGSLVKIRSLLNEISAIKKYYPIDIAGEHLQRAVEQLKTEYQNVDVTPIRADFTQAVKLPKLTHVNTLGFFPGSTIGNFSRKMALDFLSHARRSLGSNAFLLIGVDTKKSPEILHQAYNDNKNITEAFNKNILTHLNRLTGSNFNLAGFEHYAFYNPIESRVEMHLVSKQEQVVSIDGHNIYFAQGESIHTENSYKYNKMDFLQLAGKAGWEHVTQWLANDGMFSVYLLKVKTI